ncbi:hypothetical protein QQ045_017477 [Rhodiola kirilowii]
MTQKNADFVFLRDKESQTRETWRLASYVDISGPGIGIYLIQCSAWRRSTV